MNTIKIQVHVPIASAIAAGRSAYGDGVVELDDATIARLTPAARELVATAPRGVDNGALRINRDALIVGVADPEHVAAAIDAVAQQIAAAEESKRAKHEALVAAVLACGDEDWIVLSGQHPDDILITDAAGKVTSRVRRPRVDFTPPSVNGAWAVGDDPRVAARRREVEEGAGARAIAQYEAARAEWMARVAEAEAVKAAEARAVKEEQRAAIRAAIAARGTKSQLERFDADCLPSDELHAVLREAWLPRIAGVKEYVKMTPADVEHDVDGCACDVSFSASPVDGPWSDAQWAVIKRVREAQAHVEANAVVTPIEHEARTECGEKTFRYGVRVVMTRHGMKVQREYALPGDDEVTS